MECASVCPICSQTLQLGTSEPHPTRDGADILTYRCEQCSPIKSKLWSPSQRNGLARPALRAEPLANSRRPQVPLVGPVDGPLSIDRGREDAPPVCQHYQETALG
jgi:hypothetical protein